MMEFCAPNSYVQRIVILVVILIICLLNWVGNFGAVSAHYKKPGPSIPERLLPPTATLDTTPSTDGAIWPKKLNAPSQPSATVGSSGARANSTGSSSAAARSIGARANSTGSSVAVARSSGVARGVEQREGIRVVVLSMNRAKSLQRLLDSLVATNYGSDSVSLDIRIDGGGSAAVAGVAEAFTWPHQKTITRRSENGGLRTAWLEAWVRPEGYAIILEDDAELSPAWYSWLKGAWAAYGKRKDLAGISLQRQTLVPKKPYKGRPKEIVNRHKPFLFKLVGSVAFSPHPERWAAFLTWVQQHDLDTFDAHVNGLVTSDWYAKTKDKRAIWTQLFIRFCDERGLYTLYINLPMRRTLAAHWREKGENFKGGDGRDFALASKAPRSFPKLPVSYGWNGLPESRAMRIRGKGGSLSGAARKH